MMQSQNPQPCELPSLQIDVASRAHQVLLQSTLPHQSSLLHCRSAENEEVQKVMGDTPDQQMPIEAEPKPVQSPGEPLEAKAVRNSHDGSSSSAASGQTTYKDEMGSCSDLTKDPDQLLTECETDLVNAAVNNDDRTAADSNKSRNRSGNSSGNSSFHKNDSNNAGHSNGIGSGGGSSSSDKSSNGNSNSGGGGGSNGWGQWAQFQHLDWWKLGGLGVTVLTTIAAVYRLTRDTQDCVGSASNRQEDAGELAATGLQ